MFSLLRLYIVEEAVLSYQHCCVWQLYAMILDFLVLGDYGNSLCQ